MKKEVETYVEMVLTKEEAYLIFRKRYNEMVGFEKRLLALFIGGFVVSLMGLALVGNIVILEFGTVLTIGLLFIYSYFESKEVKVFAEYYIADLQSSQRAEEERAIRKEKTISAVGSKR